MNVPLLDLTAQLRVVGEGLKRAAAEVIDSGRYVLGPKVEEFEARIAAYTGAPYAVGLSSGTDALLAALMALEVGLGDIVLTPPYSFFATAGSVARLGATPAFVDIDPKTYTMSPAVLRTWFEENTDKATRAKAIIPVHLYGQCADMAPILEIAAEYGAAVIEDAAQAIGAKYPAQDGVKCAGAMGTMGCFSFFPSKNLGGLGDGGMLTSNSEELAARVRQLRNHGARVKYDFERIGGNFRLDALQAALLLVKLEHLEEWHAARRENAAYYDAHITAPEIVKPFLAYSRDCHIYNQYVISVPERRDELRAFLSERGIGSEVYYPAAFHELPCFAYLGYQLGAFPNSEYAARHTLALPVYPELTRAMQDYVIEALEAFWR